VPAAELRNAGDTPAIPVVSPHRDRQSGSDFALEKAADCLRLITN